MPSPAAPVSLLFFREIFLSFCGFRPVQKNSSNREGVEGRACTISGSGNVALYAGEKLAKLGAKVLTFSDSSGYIVKEEGFSLDEIHQLKEMKESSSSKRVSEFAQVVVP